MKARSTPLTWLAPAMLLAACIENIAPTDNDDSSSVVVGAGSGRDSGPPDAAADSGPKVDAAPSKVEGTAGECTGTTPKSGDTCAGFYCGTNLDDVRAETATTAACGSDAELALICEGDISATVSRCTLMNALKTGEAFITSVKSCVQKDAAYDAFTESCLDCYAASALCAKEKCINVCASASDSEACETCREEEGCTPQFYVCAGMPDPQ